MNRYYGVLYCLFFLYVSSSGMEESKESNYKKFATKFGIHYLTEIENTVEQCYCSIHSLLKSPFNKPLVVACTGKSALMLDLGKDCRGLVSNVHDLYHGFLFLRSSYSRQLGRKLRGEIFMELFESFLGIDSNIFRAFLAEKRDCFLKNVYFSSLKNICNEHSTCLTPSIGSSFLSVDGNEISLLYVVNCSCPKQRGGYVIKRPMLHPSKEKHRFLSLSDYTKYSCGSIFWTEQSRKTLKDPDVPIKISSLILQVPLFRKEDARDCSLIYDSNVHSKDCSGKMWVENTIAQNDVRELMKDMGILANELLFNILLEESCKVPIAEQLSFLFKENKIQVIEKKTECFFVECVPLKRGNASHHNVDCAAIVTIACKFLPKNEKFCLFLTGDEKITPSSRNTLYFGKMSICNACQLQIVPVIMLKHIEKGVQGRRDDIYKEVVLFCFKAKEYKSFHCDKCATISWPFGIELGRDLLENVMAIMNYKKKQSKQHTTDEYVMSLFF